MILYIHVQTVSIKVDLVFDLLVPSFLSVPEINQNRTGNFLPLRLTRVLQPDITTFTKETFLLYNVKRYAW